MSLPGLGGIGDKHQEYDAARNAALRFLSARPRSTAEVRRRLQRRYAVEVVDRVISVLVDQGLLDDAAYAKQWREYRERSRPRGKELLRQELLRRGISPDTATEALDGFDTAGNAYRAGRSAALKLQGYDYSKFQQRLWSHLQRRGFESDVISESVARLWRELSDPLYSDKDTDDNHHQPEYTEIERRGSPSNQKCSGHRAGGDQGQPGAPLSVD